MPSPELQGTGIGIMQLQFTSRVFFAFWDLVFDFGRHREFAG